MALPSSVYAYRKQARKILPRAIYDYLEGGAETERTLERNRAMYGRFGLRSVLRDEVGAVDLSWELLGSRLAMPIVLAPTGGLKIFWPDGEEAVARAAAAAGVLMVLSASASTSLEMVAAAAPGPKLLQICVYKDWGLVRELLSRAKHAGYSGICITVDAGVIGKRERDLENELDFTLKFALRNIPELIMHLGWSMRTLRVLPLRFPNLPSKDNGEISVAEYVAGLMEPCPSWKELAEIRKEWSGPIIIKGISSTSDASRAVEEGMDGIVVSNHGGRQFDSGFSTVELLPDIAEEVSGRIPIILDGGIFRGTDVLKALSLGASACMIGRAHLWGLAASGEHGARRVLELLRAEIHNAMCLCGSNTINQLNKMNIAPLR